jgi:hypothetical protein|tara:strand:+ start:385 stop:531 length:147 start_codon:yes stop_codon:yes gene_type:complete
VSAFAGLSYRPALRFSVLNRLLDDGFGVLSAGHIDLFLDFIVIIFVVK